MTDLVLTADRIFDGSVTHARTAVRISAGTIDAVGDIPPASATRHDFPGCTILPGLIDTHVHLCFSALDTHPAIVEQVGRETDEQLLTRTLSNARAALRAGITTVRDCGGKGDVILRARDAIRRGAEGADVLSCGMPI